MSPAADALTSLAFVAAGLAIVVGRRAERTSRLAFGAAGLAIVVGRRAERTSRLVFGALVAAVGVGSVVQHGPNPPWADAAHDLPLLAVIAFVAVDAAADLVGRRLPHAWWMVPALALTPVIVAAPRPADAAQAAMAAVAIVLSLRRAWIRPEFRVTILGALVLLGVGALIGTVWGGGWPPYRPQGAVPGHSVWHVLAATALWRLTPVIGRVHAPHPVAPVVPRGDDATS
ncbi:MAG: hypothetical protein ACRDUY_08330 [Nitriliruptorales bacterium]